MKSLTIKISDSGSNHCCAICGEYLGPAQGPGLHLADSGHRVCRQCGKHHAPHLVALVDLAHVAERVGQSCRHLLVPPMAALLALASAAEDYTAAKPCLHNRAA